VGNLGDQMSLHVVQKGLGPLAFFAKVLADSPSDLFFIFAAQRCREGFIFHVLDTEKVPNLFLPVLCQIGFDAVASLDLLLGLPGAEFSDASFELIGEIELGRSKFAPFLGH
jgi:hypothetical protein